ncbi:MAG: hypothetical protein ACFBWO_05520 [Paracoccaceae bacterium]
MRAPVLVLAGLTGCAPVLPDLVALQRSGDHAAIVARADEVEAVCTDDPAPCAQARAVLGHACLALARRAPGEAARASLDCAVEALDAALAAGLPPSVGGRAVAVYEASRLDALNRRIGLAPSAGAAAPDAAALDRAAAGFAARYPADWRGPFYRALAALQLGDCAGLVAAAAGLGEVAGGAARIDATRRALAAARAGCAGEGSR